MVDGQSSAEWRKSSLSGANGCVEVGLVDGKVAVRSSNDRSGPMVVFTSLEWEAFLGGVRKGEFDLTSG
jgi:hypothetical protein